MSGSLRLRSLLAASVSAAAMVGVAAPAFAQDTTIGEIVVTAQKKEEALQDVPIAVSAFSQDSLEAAKIDGGPNLVLAIPNVNFSKGNFTGYNFQIRGIGSKLVADSGDAGTGIHLNNAPLTANNLFESEFFDVERVEVLRGPQGTLYGRNATGGVVNLISAKPVDSFEAMVRGEVGNFGSRKLRGMVNVPLGDTLALRVSANVMQRDGFGENTYTGSDADDRDMWNTRATLAFNPSDTFRTWLLWDHFEEDDARSRIGKQLCVKDLGPANIGGLGYSAAYGGLIGQVQRGFFSQGCAEAKVNDPNILGTVNSQGTLGGLFGALTGLQTGDAYAGQMQDPDIRNISSVEDPVYQAKTDIVQFNLAIDLTDELQLTALTGYSKNSLFTRQDYNRVVPNATFNSTPNPVNAYGAPLAAAYISAAQMTTCGATTGVCADAVAATPSVQTAAAGYYASIYSALFPGGNVTDPQVGARNRFSTLDISSGDSTSWSQELRLQSAFDGPFNFNVGAIYVDYVATSNYYVMFNTGTAYYQLGNTLNAGGAGCAPTTAGCVYIDPNSNPNGSGHNYYNSTGEYHLRSSAAFGELYWQLTDTFKVTGGLRYTHDAKRTENRPVTLGTVGSGSPLSADPYSHADFKEMTGRLGFDWKPEVSFTDETLVYLFYSRGYKGGGMNPQCSVSVFSSCPSATFDPEFVDAWEIGTKNTLLGGAMVLNLTAFKYDYIGYQVSKIVNRQAANENIDAQIKGLELESVWSPMDGLRLNMNVGYLQTEITNGTSIDTFNRTQSDPLLTLIKSSAASNCVITTASAQAWLGYSTATNNPFALLGACSVVAPAAAGDVLFAGGPASVGYNAFGQMVSDGVEVDLKGKELPNSPEWTFSFGAQYAWSMGGWDATLRADYYRQTSTFSRIYNSDADKLDSWHNANATFVVSNDEMGLSIEAYVKNLTDEEVITDTYLTDDSSGLFRNGFYGEPRTYGLSVTKTF